MIKNKNIVFFGKQNVFMISIKFRDKFFSSSGSGSFRSKRQGSGSGSGSVRTIKQKATNVNLTSVLCQICTYAFFFEESSQVYLIAFVIPPKEIRLNFNLEMKEMLFTYM